ncbi:SusC/RagA family TonB-linked outer membrane protein [Thermoflexibacter ruber]|uniref:TonB-linked outer membrane protein, SusC/RagA family n=1 Tax=Thermoflexibacter ruber TaxID=1003 RepID=A0A1I2FFI7_9BACT|nr:TonB-dependent receptor [Thermoflexibacter ruber]SFF03241.1 TonB-linked outer membrane protein, SusC/RagA family [Thermoflexibacter ruber]
MKRLLLYGLVLLTAIAFTNIAQAQDRVISGKVTSSEDGNPLPGVNVVVKGTTVGTATSTDGTYKLQVPSNAQALIFSFVGFLNQEVQIGNRSTIDISMQTDQKLLTEVVVVGYGTQNKKELTGSVASVRSEEIANLPLLGVDQALQGRAAGVMVTQNSGTPGGGIAVRVRGSGSITGSNEPLYVVDGVPINTGSYARFGVGNQQTNALADLNPSDIESFEILKDGASAAIYGSRASNGVVLITTKRGKQGKTNIDFGFYTGVQQVWKKVGLATGPQYVEALQEGVRNRFGANVVPSQLGLVGLDNAPSSYPTADWFSEIFRTAPISQYDLSVSGGTENTKFRISGTYFDQQGIVLGSGFNRFNTRINLDHSISKKVKVGMSLGITRSAQNRIQNDNNIYGVVSAAILLGTHIPVRNPDGTYGRDPNASVDNPVAVATEPLIKVITHRLIGNAYLEYEIIKGLTFKTSWGTDAMDFRERFFLPTTTNQGAGVNGEGREVSTQDISWLTENTLNFTKKFGEKHNFNALIGATYQESNYESILTVARVFPGNDIKRLSAGAVKTDASSSGTSWGIASYLARVNYDFAGKYLFSASIRYDGSSRFSEANRWGTFPSVSAGWRISEENFMKGIEFLSDLKLRATYGVTGNQEFGNFSYLGLYGSGNNYLQRGGIAPSQLANPNLTWEKGENINAGLDVGFLSDRFSFSVDYFIRNTNALLLNRQLPLTSGFGSITENIGSVENKGLEIALNTTNVNTSSFKWTTNFNISFIRNKITALFNNQPFAAGFANWVAVGEPLGAFRGFRVEKIFQTQEEIDQLNAEARNKFGAGAVYQAALTRPGDFKFKDINGDGRITTDDQEILGNAQPKFFGGITNNLSYKGFDLMFFFQFMYGNSIWNHTRVFSEGMNSIFGQTSGILNRWTPNNTNTNMPRAVWGDPNNNRRNSDHWIEDGSYLRLKNVVLGYTLPKSLIEKTKVFRNARLYVAAQNLLTFTKYSGLDPEVNTFSGSNISLGTDFLTFPQARTMTIGVNLGL